MEQLVISSDLPRSTCHQWPVLPSEAHQRVDLSPSTAIAGGLSPSEPDAVAGLSSARLSGTSLTSAGAGLSVSSPNEGAQNENNSAAAKDNDGVKRLMQINPW